MGFIFVLIDVALSWDMPFCQLQQLQHFYGSAKGYFCSPLYSIPFSTTAQVMICTTQVMALVRDLRSAVLAGVILMLFLLGMLPKVFEELVAKQKLCCNKVTHPLLNRQHSVFSLMAELIVEILFMLFSIYNAVYWAENETHSLMDFPLINE